MLNLSGNKIISLNESHTEAVKEALELYRNQLTLKLYGNTKSNFNTEYYDIEILVVDEILEKLGEV
jgi:hypothetical protein